MAEVLRVLRDKFAYAPEVLEETETKLTGITNRAKPIGTLRVIQTDRSDSRILECAAAAKSDYIVTGDAKHILPLGSFAGIPIVRVAEFLRLLGEQHWQER
jgi:predicted nucleic acid-binding protein